MFVNDDGNKCETGLSCCFVHLETTNKHKRASMHSVRCNTEANANIRQFKKKRIKNAYSNPNLCKWADGLFIEYLINLTIVPSLADSEFEDMDGQVIHFRPEPLEKLCQLTKFTKRELQMMYRGFKQVRYPVIRQLIIDSCPMRPCKHQEAPNGVVREETFKHIYSQFFPKGADTNQYAHYVFNTFDPDRTGIVTFTVGPSFCPSNCSFSCIFCSCVLIRIS